MVKVVCVIITSSQHLANSPANLLLEKAVSKLPLTSVANFSQIVTVDKSFFIEQVSMVPKKTLEKIDCYAKGTKYPETYTLPKQQPLGC